MEAPQQSQPLYPVCPYCGTTPLTLTSLPVQLGSIQAVVIACGAAQCRKVFNVQIMAVERSRIQPAGTMELQKMGGL